MEETSLKVVNEFEWNSNLIALLFNRWLKRWIDGLAVFFFIENKIEFFLWVKKWNNKKKMQEFSMCLTNKQKFFERKLIQFALFFLLHSIINFVSIFFTEKNKWIKIRLMSVCNLPFFSLFSSQRSILCGKKIIFWMHWK